MSGVEGASNAGLAATAAASLSRGLDWLAQQIDAEGSIQGSGDAVTYYKPPATLAIAGRTGPANRCLRWAATRFIGSGGELEIPPEQERVNPFNAYDRGWLCWGAHLCGRYDLAYRLADDLLGFQDRLTGGFWDSRAARDAQSGPQHAMSAGMAGFALLATRHLDAAAHAAQFIGDCIAMQPDAATGLHFVVDVSKGARRLATERTRIAYLDCRGEKQRPGRLGPILVLLARLHRITGDASLATTASVFVKAMLAGGPGAYLCVEGHKFVWGLAELEAAMPGIVGETERAAADAIVSYLIESQRPEGNWQVDAGITDPSAPQPLFWRVDTTCNVLFGLVHYLAGSRRSACTA